MSLEQLEHIFEDYCAGIYKGEYIVSFETPHNIGNDILNCRAELAKEGKNIIALIGFRK